MNFNRAVMANSISDELYRPILDGLSMPALHHANPLPNKNVRNFSLATQPLQLVRFHAAICTLPSVIRSLADAVFAQNLRYRDSAFAFLQNPQDLFFCMSSFSGHLGS